jgi:hypothetical protein
MEKLKSMNLQLSELQESRAATVISALRKHSDSSVATAAKNLRAYWKESMTGTTNVSTATVTEVSNANETGEAVSADIVDEVTTTAVIGDPTEEQPSLETTE